MLCCLQYVDLLVKANWAIKDLKHKQNNDSQKIDVKIRHHVLHFQLVKTI